MTDYWIYAGVGFIGLVAVIAFIKVMTKPADHSSHSALIETDVIDPEIDPEKCLAPAEDMMPDCDVYTTTPPEK